MGMSTEESKFIDNAGQSTIS